MEGNQTTTTTVATGEAATTVSPIASNITALEDYDVWTPWAYIQKQVAEMAWSKPANLEEAIMWKTLDEQIKIINEYNQQEIHSTKWHAEVEDGASLAEKWYKSPDQIAAEEAEQARIKAEEAAGKWALDEELNALENELENNKTKEEQEAQRLADEEAEKNPDNREEMTAEERDEHRQNVEDMEHRIEQLSKDDTENKKVIYAKDAEIDILKSTIENLKTHIKDISGKAQFYESSSDVIKWADESQLINLRRLSASDPEWQAWINYLYHLSTEWAKLTGQDLSTQISKLFQDNVARQWKAYSQEYDITKTQIKEENADDKLREYGV
jgi:hypothetical protein